ncbi:MAG: hypothetical protein J7M25_12300 [Deltaproteobacteria bacterium]|nr:hypothetical protein [Deltaproteobacteria bacterium]
MNHLIAYLLENLILDFQGNLDLDMVRHFLKDDQSREGKALYAKLVEEGGVSDMLLVLADCLKDALPKGIDEEVIRKNLATYSDS